MFQKENVGCEKWHLFSFPFNFADLSTFTNFTKLKWHKNEWFYPVASCFTTMKSLLSVLNAPWLMQIVDASKSIDDLHKELKTLVTNIMEEAKDKDIGGCLKLLSM